MPTFDQWTAMTPEVQSALITDRMGYGYTFNEIKEAIPGPPPPILPTPRATTPRRNGSDPGPTPPPPDDEPASAVDRLRAAVLHGDEIQNLPPLVPLVDGWLDLNTLAVLYGRPAGGKSLVALDLACSIATGSWWHGNEVDTNGLDVLYIAAEGAAGTGKRLAAWKSSRRYYGDPERLHIIPQPTNLLDPVMTECVSTVAMELGARFIIIDTLARSMPGGDENASRDMGSVISAVDRIRAATGGCVLLVHHSGKDTSAGARGHSSLLGAVNTELELKSTDRRLVLSTTKQKDHAEQQPLHLSIVTVDGTDSVTVTSGRPPEATTEEISRTARAALQALEAIAVPGGISTATWRETALDPASNYALGRSSFYTAVRTLLDQGHVQNLGTDKAPRYTPTDQAERS